MMEYALYIFVVALIAFSLYEAYKKGVNIKLLIVGAITAILGMFYKNMSDKTTAEEKNKVLKEQVKKIDEKIVEVDKEIEEVHEQKTELDNKEQELAEETIKIEAKIDADYASKKEAIEKESKEPIKDAETFIKDFIDSPDTNSK